MSTYCAPCLADLALVREAVTSVSGTSACVAHAVLLTHPGDTPQRRLSRLTDLRSIAEGKLLTASAEDVPAIELLVQEYALAGAMDMTVPLKDLAGDRTPRPPKPRRERGRDRDRERGPRPDRPDRGPERGPRPGEAAAPADGDVTAAPEATVASAEADTSAPEASGRSEVAPEAQAPTPAPEAPAPAAEAPAPAAEAPAPAPAVEPAAPTEAPVAAE